MPEGNLRPDVSVCTPVYRRHKAPHVGTLASSMEAALDGLRGELVVPLNGITADRVPLPDHAITLPFPVNRGVPVAWNAAAAEARGEVLCFVNDDVVLGAGSLRRLWNVLTERPEAGVAGPVGTRWDIERFRHLKWLDVSQLEPGEVLECEVVSGFCFGTRREVFRQTGGFDEAYTPCGAEEVDYCTTVRLRLGLKCYAVAGVAHQHEFGISTARRWRRLSYDGRSETVGRIAARNREYFLSKWTGEDPPGLAWAPGQASAVGRADRLA